jgi:hypothetical protein
MTTMRGCIEVVAGNKQVAEIEMIVTVWDGCDWG